MLPSDGIICANNMKGYINTMKLRKVLSFVTAVTIALNTAVSSLPAAAADPPGSSWTSSNGSYTYTTDGSEGTNFEFDVQGKSTEAPSTITWSNYRYASLKVANNGTKTISTSVSFKNDVASWIDSGESKTFLVEVDSTTDSPWFAVNFDTTDSSSFTAGESVTVSDIRLYATADDIEIYNTWYTTDNSTYIYKTQNAETEISDYFNFDLDNAGVSDWSAIKYISADVKVTGKANPSINGDDLTPNAKLIENGTQTLYLNLNGEKPEWVNIGAWAYDDNGTCIAANTIIEVSNIKYSTTERDYSNVYGEWYYLSSDNSWNYKQGNQDGTLPSLDISDSTITNWSTIKYVSVDVEVTGKTNLVITSEEKNAVNGWMSGAANVIESTSQAKAQTLYLTTNGKELNYVNLDAWNYDEADQYSIAANTVVKVKNITYSTTERDYSNTYDEWYYQSSDKSWNYKAEAKKDWVESPIFDSSSVTDWSKIKYISADIEITGDAYPVICATDKNNTENAVTGSAITIKDASRTIYLNTNGAELQDVRLNLWGFGEGDNYAAVKDGVVIKVKNITFSETERDYTNVYDEWYPVTGGWQLKVSGKSQELSILRFEDYITIPSFTIAEFELNVENGKTCYDVALYKNGNSATKNFSGGEAPIEKITVLATDYENQYDKMSVYIYDATAGAIVTVSTPTFSTATSIPNYKNYTNTLVEFEKGKYYFHGTGVEVGESSEVNLNLPYSGDLSEIQSIKVTGYATAKLNSQGWYGTAQLNLGCDGSFGHTFPLTETASTVERYYIGSLKGDFITMNITGFHSETEITITAIEYNLEPVELPLSTPNDILIDYSETTLSASNGHTISAADVSKIETTGTLRFDLEFLPNMPEADLYWYQLVFSDWTIPANESGWATLCTNAITGSCTIEYKITEEDVEHIKRCGNEFAFVIGASEGIKSSNVWFTPESDAPAPTNETFDPDKTFNAQEKQDFENQLSQSKNNQMTELEGFKHIRDKNKYDKPQGHKHFKKDKNGNDIYSMRIVKMVDKEKLKGARSISITVYSKKSGRYVTVTAESCYGQLNVNGQICEAEQDMAFLTVVFDNVQGDDEITYTDFTINY